jgi:hypothetical protein
LAALATMDFVVGFEIHRSNLNVVWMWYCEKLYWI